MKLSSIVEREAVLQIDSLPDKWAVIRALVERLTATPFAQELDAAVVASFLAETERRESLGGTGLGHGVAFPHGRIAGLERPLVAFATLRHGVDFGAPDGAPARLVLLFLLPARRVQLGVKIHAVCSRFLTQEEVRQALLAAADRDAILRIMDHEVPEIDSPVIALDLMRAERVRLTPDMPVREAVRTMHACRNVAAPVVDSGQRVVGELDCNDLFHLELPDYITRLHSVPPVSDFRPFRQYFDQDARLTVGDLMSECDAVIDETASLLEVIFMLSVKKHPLLYVCREGVLIGVIDPITVLDKVLNL